MAQRRLKRVPLAFAGEVITWFFHAKRIVPGWQVGETVFAGRVSENAPLEPGALAENRKADLGDNGSTGSPLCSQCIVASATDSMQARYDGRGRRGRNSSVQRIDSKEAAPRKN
jgi:hypothetical protein